jgi:hypothetical protein
VSAWASGRAKAREDQVKPLLARYGHRLNRTSSRVYLVQQEPPVPWEETAEGLLLSRLQSDPEGYAREVMSADEVEALLRPHVRRSLRPEFQTDAPFDVAVRLDALGRSSELLTTKASHRRPTGAR